MDVMAPMMVEILSELKTGETAVELRSVVDEFIWRLTGKETVYQMMALAEEISKRGGTPLDPLVYKRQYLDRLWEVIRERVEELRAGRCSPDKYLVPGARRLLESLRARGFEMYLASGTDEEFVLEEAALLDVARYFDGRIYGALDDLKRFSKQMIVQQILATPGITGEQLLGFGDGYVEIEELKRAGGVAVGVATAEPECRTVDAWKRQRLIGVGADYIIPNYLAHGELMETLFGTSSHYATFDR